LVLVQAPTKDKNTIITTRQKMFLPIGMAFSFHIL
jgi:hypothetical protein